MDQAYSLGTALLLRFHEQELSHITKPNYPASWKGSYMCSQEDDLGLY